MSSQPDETRRRILVIDDNEEIHADFRKILTPDKAPKSLAEAKTALFGAAAPVQGLESMPRFEVETAVQGEEGVAKVTAALESGDPYQVAFVDMRMPPGWDGLTTIKHLWNVDPAVEVVICTAYSDHALERVGGELQQVGRLLVLKKPFDNAEILQLAATLSAKWQFERQAAMRVEELEHIVHARTAEIEHAMLHDKLTGLPNRTMLMQSLEHCIELHRRSRKHKFAVLFLDFDRFKLINDSLGHAVGDHLLVEIATRLRRSLRGVDSVSRASTPSRLGGDEFIVLLDDLNDTRDATRVAQRLLDALAEPYVLGGQKLFSTASIGIATSDRGYEHAGDMLRDADTAMYRAKAEGRARFVMFDQEMHREALRRLALETALRTAIRDDHLTLHYQPIVRLSDNALEGFEALVRWNDPVHGSVPANEIVSVAEETGLIHPLGLSVLRLACGQMKTWQDRHPRARGLRMSVNLSRKQLVDPDLVNKILGIVAEAGITPGSISLEVTESALLHDTDAAISIFEQIRKAGFEVHLDDFGTGYSSLSCLYRLPLSGIKIDRAFVQDACTVEEHARVLEAIVEIARAFKLRSTAEGVETEAQLAKLRELRVDYAQGYFLGRPAAAEPAEEYLQSRLAGSAAPRAAKDGVDPKKSIC